MSLRSLSNEWRDEIRAERGIGLSRKRRDPDVVTWALIVLSAALMATAIYKAWPASRDRPNLHTPAPPSGDSFRRELDQIKQRLAAIEDARKPHKGLPGVLPDEASLKWGKR